MSNGQITTRKVKGTEAGIPTKAPVWKTVAVEFLGFPPEDHAPVPSYIMKAIWSFDPQCVPLWIRRVYRTHEEKLAIRIFNGMGFQSFNPSQQGKEPIYLLRPSGGYRFNGPVYEDRVWEWYPRNVQRRDIPGVYLPWDEHRLAELRASYWSLYGRMNGAEKTESYVQAMFPSKDAGLRQLNEDAKDRLADAAGPFQNPYVGYTGKQFTEN